MNTEIKPNRFFVYEGEILRAAQPKFNTAMRYFKEGRKMMYGTALGKKIDISKVAIKVNKWDEN
jgi:hypothetical protein